MPDNELILLHVPGSTIHNPQDSPVIRILVHSLAIAFRQPATISGTYSMIEVDRKIQRMTGLALSMRQRKTHERSCDNTI